MINIKQKQRIARRRKTGVHVLYNKQLSDTGVKRDSLQVLNNMNGLNIQEDSEVHVDKPELDFA